jgi:26S proteasome regulatory subunit N7
LIDKGGDWDRKNRLKVYEAMYLIAIRDIPKASELLQSCIATFTCVEICTYNQFMFYALLTAIMTLPRIDLKKKIVLNPQVISVIRDVPNMQQLLRSIYDCDYRIFLQTLLVIHPRIVGDRFLGPHATFIVREYRILAYSQFLEAYRSVMMSSMAASFGLTLELLDEELSRFIAAGRINAKIDKVGDIVETSRPDKKNAQYTEIVKKGDVLLNQIQKLVRVIDT